MRRHLKRPHHPVYYLSVLPGVVLAAFLSLLPAAEQPSECADARSCRQAALEAAERKDFETFHDLAWRAVQKGRRNDPELMLLLARAQSLSGRPGDALVMLRRLTESGFLQHDAATSDDFERVRALPGWAALEAAIVALGEKRSNEIATTPAERPRGKAAPDKAETTAAPADSPAGAPSIKPESTIKEAPRAARRGSKRAGEEAIRLPPAPFQAVGLAYDVVSRRFVLGDARKNRLVVADEVFKRVNDLLGAGSGGFGALTAVEIDSRRGDLWVTSAGSNGSASVHKLQLVSGRVLTRVEVPDDWLPATLADLCMSNSGELLMVDGVGSRLLTLGVVSERFGRSLPLDVPSPSSVTTTESIAYVSHADGLSTVDLRTGHVAAVRAAQGITLTGLRRIRWHEGWLVAIQDDDTGEQARLVRLRIGRNRTTVSRLEILDDQFAADGSVLTLSGDDAFYLARTGEGPSIRRVRLPYLQP